MHRAKDALVDWAEACATGFAVQNVVASYSTVVAISRFTAEWVGRMWGVKPEIIYPPCDDLGPPLAKQKSILHVGRFIADIGERTRHHKGQGFLLETFKGMTELQGEGWELHFVGSVGADEESEKFAASLVRSAAGFPVTFHFDAGQEKLRELYRRAAVYWHATGCGLSIEAHPAAQEHYGMTTVEAMSAGAVPVVYSSGGQKEIVSHGANGLCWTDRADLVRLTAELAHDPALYDRLSRQAVASSRRFGREAFAVNIDRLIEKLMSGGSSVRGL
jgi:glycosyltransferase involved in cell wall biosynthesis